MRHLLVQDSDIIHSVGFEPNAYLTGAMEVVFKSDLDTVYRYERVAFDTFTQLISSESIGKSFHEMFRKTKHPFKKSVREQDKLKK
jgi:hypothetical protein